MSMANFIFFQPISNADFIVPVEIDGTVHQVSGFCLVCLSNVQIILICNNNSCINMSLYSVVNLLTKVRAMM